MADKFSPEYNWIKRGANARLLVNIPGGPRKGAIGTVRGKPDHLFMVPVNFGSRHGGEILVLTTQIEKV